MIKNKPAEVNDKSLLEIARNMVADILEKDPDLGSAENLQLKKFLKAQKGNVVWSKIS